MSGPLHLNLEYLRKEAKKLSRDLRTGLLEAQTRLRVILGHAGKEQAGDGKESERTLSIAQFVVARENGFQSWPALKRYLKSDFIRIAHTKLMDLMADVIPEKKSGEVVVRNIARLKGHQAKIALDVSDLELDPIGLCVGSRGCRIRRIVEALDGEKIDLIRWSPSPELYIKNALSPAHADVLWMDPEARYAGLGIQTEDEKLIMGNRGQNLRLAGELTSWSISIIGESSGAYSAG